MTLRGNRVLARCEPDGELRVEGGRVEIRYGPRAQRAYRAGRRNLEPVEGAELLPDDHCVDLEEEPPAKPARPRRKKTSRAGPPPTSAEGDEIIVYAGGACLGNPGPAGLGVVLVTEDGRRELGEHIGRGTNNIAELTAILRAAEAIGPTDRPVRIYTDSSYAIGLLTKGWKAKKNKELVARVRGAVAKLADHELHHVPGHAGVPLNERADDLAREAAESEASTGWITVE